MTSDRAIRLLTRHWTTVVWFAIFGVLLAIGLSFTQPLEYRASIRLLITQESVSADAFTASRSAERVADDLANILLTTAVFDQVLESNFNISTDQFPSREANPQKRRRVWEKMIEASVQRGTGFLTVNVYNRDPEEASQVSQAIAFVLTQQGWRYTSGGNISVRLVDQPLVSRRPVRPNIPANAFVGLVLGSLLGVVYVLVKAGQIRRRQGLHSRS